MVLAAAPAAAQVPVRAAGSVMRIVAGDSVPLGGARVVLHKVGREFQGPLDSALTSRDGTFSFRFRADTTAVYLLSTRHQGIQYFSTPIHVNPALPDSAILMVVSDTSSSAPLEVASRNVVIGSPGTDGSRNVVDLVGVENAGIHTRVAGAAQQPTMTIQVPDSIVGFNVGAGDFSPEAVFLDGYRVEVFGPVSPGERELLMRYVVPSGTAELVFTFADTVRDFSVLIEDSGPSVVGPAMAAPDSQVIGGHAFRAWRARPAPGDTIRVILGGGSPVSPSSALVGLVLLLGLSLAVGAVIWRRRPRPVVATESVATLVRRLAELDASFQERNEPVAGQDRAAYLAERSALKKLLEEALAGRRPGP